MVKELTLYGTVHSDTERYLDENIKVNYQAVKKVKLVGTWKHDNGYEVNECGIYQDAQGRRYNQYRTIDWGNNTYYVREGDNILFNPRRAHNARNAVTLEPL